MFLRNHEDEDIEIFCDFTEIGELSQFAEFYSPTSFSIFLYDGISVEYVKKSLKLLKFLHPNIKFSVTQNVPAAFFVEDFRPLYESGTTKNVWKVDFLHLSKVLTFVLLDEK